MEGTCATGLAWGCSPWQWRRCWACSAISCSEPSPWGLNAPLWLLALVVGAGLLVWQARLPLLGEGRWLALVALAFAAGIALRDSPVLLAVNLLAVLLTLGLAGHRATGGWPVVGGLPQYVGALLSAGFHACGGVLVLTLYDVRWNDVPRTGWTSRCWRRLEAC